MPTTLQTLVNLLRAASCPCGCSEGAVVKSCDSDGCKWCAEREQFLKEIETDFELLGLSRSDSGSLKLMATFIDYIKTENDILTCPGAVCHKRCIVETLRDLAKKVEAATPELPPDKE